MKYFSHPVKNKKNWKRTIVSTATLVAIVSGFGLTPAFAEPTADEITYLNSTYPHTGNSVERADGSLAWQLAAGQYHYGIKELNFDPIMLAKYEEMGVKIDVDATIALTNKTIKSNNGENYSNNLQLVVDIDPTAFKKHPASEDIDITGNNGEFYGNYGLASPYGFNNVTTDSLQDKSSFVKDKAHANGSFIMPHIMGINEIQNPSDVGWNYDPETGSFDTFIGLHPLSSYYEGEVVNEGENAALRSWILDATNPVGENRAADASIGYKGQEVRGMNQSTTANCLVTVCGGQFQLVAEGLAGEDGNSLVAVLEPLTFTVKFEETTNFPQTFANTPWVGVNGDKVFLEHNSSILHAFNNGVNPQSDAKDFRNLTNDITKRNTNGDTPEGFFNVLSSLNTSVSGEGVLRLDTVVDNSKYSYDTDLTVTKVDNNTVEIIFTNGNDVITAPWVYSSEEGVRTLAVGDVIHEDGETYTVTSVTHNTLTLSLVSEVAFDTISSTIGNTYGRSVLEFNKESGKPELVTGVNVFFASNPASTIGSYAIVGEFTELVEEVAPLARPDVKSGKYGEPVVQKVTVNDEVSEGWELIISSIVLTDPTDSQKKKSVTYADSGTYEVINDTVVFNGIEGFSGEAPKTVYTWTETRTNPETGEEETREVSSTVQAIIEPAEKPVEEIPTPEETPVETPVKETPIEEVPVETPIEEVPAEDATVALKDGGESPNMLILFLGSLLTLVVFGAKRLVSIKK